jgi:acetyltransferase-like isoleucine patch superfamily enzyme
VTVLQALAKLRAPGAVRRLPVALTELARGAVHGYRGVRVGRGVSIRGRRRVVISRGCRLLPGVRIRVEAGASLVLGPRVVVGPDSDIDVAAGRCEIGAGAQLGWGSRVVLPAAAVGASLLVRVRRSAVVGAWCRLEPGTDVGRGALVGARSTVASRVPDGAVAAGNPVRVLVR